VVKTALISILETIIHDFDVFKFFKVIIGGAF